MNRDELKAYLDAQIEEIQKYKWTESERERRDIGFNRAALEWIERYGEQFYHHWVGLQRADGRNN
ncbi:MAG: hypothetical protein ABFD69_03675 [Candidatus Sumerlaeia bacterium]